MTKGTLMMLRRIALYDSIILLLSVVISIIFFREYVIILIIGLIIALVNFLLNSVITEYAMKASKGRAWILVGTVGRIAIAAAFVLILYDNDMKNVIAYLIGYSLHYVSMIISMAVQRNKR